MSGYLVPFTHQHDAPNAKAATGIRSVKMPEWRPRTHGQRNTTLTLNKKKEYDRLHPVARLDNPSPEVLRDCIRDGYCWWCGLGGWKALAGHTSRAHGITANDIRDMAGLFKHIPTCLPELSHDMSGRMKQQLNDGIRQSPKQKPPGYKMNFSEAGWKYQVEVKSVELAKHRGKGQVRMAQMRLEGRHFGKPVQPHLCPACGKSMPYSFPITCSPECRKIVRQRTAKVSQATMKKLSTARPEYRQNINRKLSETMKRQFRDEGRLGPTPLKPHPCRICGEKIPTATPRLCSPECRSKAWHEAQVKATSKRKRIITLEERERVGTRYLSGESSIKLACEYGISPRYVRLIGKINILAVA